MAQEIRSLTGARGVAAVYVVLHHFFPSVIYTNVAVVFLSHGYLAVDFFFVLSGYILALTYRPMFLERGSWRTYKLFLGRRIARIYPLYVAATLCVAAMVLLGWWSYLKPAAVPDVLADNLAMVQSWGIAPSMDPPAWSISCEWASYLAFPLLLPLVFGRRVWAGLAALGCVAALVFAVRASDIDPRLMLNIVNPHDGLPVVRCMAEFILGLISLRLTSSSVGRWLGAASWRTSALGIGVVLLLGVEYTDVLIVMLFPLLLAGLAAGPSLARRLLSSAPTMALGTLSYSIYLVHELTLPLLSWVHAAALRHGLSHVQTCTALVGLPLTFALAYPAYKLIELPGRRWMRNMFEEKPSPEVAALPAPIIASGL